MYGGERWPKPPFTFDVMVMKDDQTSVRLGACAIQSAPVTGLGFGLSEVL
jgi:hypothetical protein